MSDEIKNSEMEYRQNMQECQFDSENMDSIADSNGIDKIDKNTDNVNPDKRGKGRPSKYWPELHNNLARAYAMAGLGLEVIAGQLDIALSTLYEWKEKYPDFSEALSAGKQYADEVVEAKLFQRATGYDHKAVKIFMPANAEEPVYAPYIEHVPPDVTAAKLWLTNRKPKEWRDKVEVDANVNSSIIPPKNADELDAWFNTIKERKNNATDA